MLKKIIGKIAGMMLGISISAHVFAEALVEDFQTWANVTGQGSFAPVNPDLKKFRWWLEGQGRFGNDSSVVSQGIVRPGIGYSLNDKTSVWLGYAWVPTGHPFALAQPFNEDRIWQQLLWADNFSFGRITTRSRFEQRFFDHHAPGHHDVAHRFRQLIKLNVPLRFLSPQWSYVIQDELFINLTNTDRGISNGFDQNRFFTGLAYRINPVAVVEVGYMNLYFNRPHSTRPDQLLHIIGVNLLMNFQ